jgi:zinc protease
MRTTIAACARLLLVVMTVTTTPARSEADPPEVLLPLASSPLVTFRIQFRVGAIDDPAGKRGLTDLTASMLVEAGTARRPYEEVVERLYPMAADIHARVDMEVTTIVGEVHVDNLDAYYALLMEALLEPGFREEDLSRLRANQVNYLRKTLRGSNDEQFGKEVLGAALYAGHPYGSPVRGLASDVESITVADVRAHYQRHFTRGNVTIGLAGGYPASLLERLRADLARLGAEAPARVELPQPRPIDRVGVVAVEKACNSTAISIGFPISVTRADADFYPLMIANSCLGEHRTFNGRLMIRMRQVRGLNYGDYSYIENFIQEGGSTFPLANIPRRQQFFSIWIRPVAHEHRHFAVRLALFELERLVRDGLDEADFEATRAFLVNYSRLWAQSQSRRLGYLMDSTFYGTDDFLETLPERLAAVTLEQVNAAIHRHLGYENLRIAVITQNADDFLSALAGNVPSPITYETDAMPADVLAEDALVAAYRLNVNRADSQVLEADDTFE